MAWLRVLLLVAALAAAAHAARPIVSDGEGEQQSILSSKGKIDKKHKHKNPYVAPTGLFIQERASKQLPGPGQHFSFGALVGWDRIHQLLDTLPDSKLLLLVRHGQAVSNYLSDSLGPDEWFKWEEKCEYREESGNGTLGIFDAELTELGTAEAQALNSMLKDGDWFSTLAGGQPTRAVISPLSRCLQTASLVLEGLPLSGTDVEENVRETLGEDTCDARRAASDPTDQDKEHLQSVCKFESGLRSKFPQYSFPISPERPAADGGGRAGFGLLADRDPLWTEDRETQVHQTKRALSFLNDLWTFAPERVAFVVTHSGFTRSVLLAVGREPYRPQNTELVPVLLQRVPRAPEAEAEGTEEAEA